MNNEDLAKIIGEHTNAIKNLYHQVDDLKTIQEEIKALGTSLTVLTTELKHTNAAVACQTAEIQALKNKPSKILEHAITALITAIITATVQFVLF